MNGMSYENLLLYAAATPQFDDEQDEWDETKDANNPDNFNDNDNEEFIR